MPQMNNMLVAQLSHVNKNKFKVWLTLSTVGGEILTVTKDNKILNPSRILDLQKLYKSVQSVLSFTP